MFTVFAFICHFSNFMKDENFIVSEERKKQEFYNTAYLIAFTYIQQYDSNFSNYNYLSLSGVWEFHMGVMVEHMLTTPL